MGFRVGFLAIFYVRRRSLGFTRHHQSANPAPPCWPFSRLPGPTWPKHPPAVSSSSQCAPPRISLPPCFLSTWLCLLKKKNRLCHTFSNINVRFCTSMSRIANYLVNVKSDRRADRRVDLRETVCPLSSCSLTRAQNFQRQLSASPSSSASLSPGPSGASLFRGMESQRVPPNKCGLISSDSSQSFPRVGGLWRLTMRVEYFWVYAAHELIQRAHCCRCCESDAQLHTAQGSLK